MLRQKRYREKKLLRQATTEPTTPHFPIPDQALQARQSGLLSHLAITAGLVAESESSTDLDAENPTVKIVFDPCKPENSKIVGGLPLGSVPTIEVTMSLLRQPKFPHLLLRPQRRPLRINEENQIV